jgi:hypothetical protein
VDVSERETSAEEVDADARREDDEGGAARETERRWREGAETVVWLERPERLAALLWCVAADERVRDERVCEDEGKRGLARVLCGEKVSVWIPPGLHICCK